MTDKDQADQVVSIFLRFKDCIRKYKQRVTGGKKSFIVLGSLLEYQLRTGRPVSVTEISRISGLALPNVSRLLVPLEQDGLICREKTGRTVSVIITEKGDAMLKSQWTEIIEDIKTALSNLSDEEYSAFTSAGEKILSSLEANFKNKSAGEEAC